MASASVNAPGPGDASFGQRLRRAREQAQFTQEALAARAGLSPNAVSALERGERRYPYPATVRALSTALGLTSDAARELAAAVPRRGALSPEPTKTLPDLPLSLTPLVGRDNAVATLRTVLERDDVRLVTLTGPGGVGKTRLAIAAASLSSSTFPDGVFLVHLAPVRDPLEVSGALARALGIHDDGDLPVRIAHQLRNRRCLLLLDNFEHVVRAAPLIEELLHRCPRVTALVTSRVRLHIVGEEEYVVPPLAVENADPVAWSDAMNLPAAVQLFVTRAGLGPPASLSTETIATITAICQRLDGVPLAIELAAAWTKVLSPADLLGRLEPRLKLLIGSGRRGAPHQQTMRDTIAWSYHLLTPEVQGLFRRLSVFVSGWTLASAESVATSDGARDVLTGLRTLVDASLVQTHDDADDERRFSMLETIREYAWEQAMAQGDAAPCQRAHAAWCLALAEHAAPFWFTPDQAVWADRFDRERDNLRAALAWMAENGGADAGIQLIGRLWPYWFVRGHINEGRFWTEEGVRWAAQQDTVERVRLLTGASCFVRTQGDEPHATVLGNDAIHLAEAIGAGRTLDAVHALIGAALTAGMRQDIALATALNQRILGILRELGEREPSAAALESVILVNWAALMLASGDDEHAAQLVETALPHQRRFGFTWGEADSLLVLAMIARSRGNDAAAATLCRDGMTCAWRGRDPQQMVTGLELLARLAVDTGRPEAAAKLLGAGERLIEQMGASQDQGSFSGYGEIMARVRNDLGEARYHLARMAGRAQALDQAMTEALAVVEALTADPEPRAHAARARG